MAQPAASIRPARVVSRFLSVFIIFAALVPSGLAQSKARILQPVDDNQRLPLAGAVPGMARAEFEAGRMNPTAPLVASLSFRPSPEQQAELDQLLAAQQNPNSPLYHQWITPQEYGRRFGLSAADQAKVKSWLESHGLTVLSVAPSANHITFQGSTAQVEAAFLTEMHHYSMNGELHFAPSVAPSVPTAFASVLAGVRNLDDFRPRARVKVKPDFTSSISGNHFLVPDDVATIYNLKPLYAAGLDGTGQKVAIIGQTDILTADITAFRAAAGLSATLPTKITVPNSGTLVISSGDLAEADLDIEYSGGVAKNATIVYITTGNNTNFNAFDSLQYAITANLAPVISSSYGNCEANLGGTQAGNFNVVLQTWVQQANSQGQTVLSASGDSGAADCDFGSNTAVNGPAVDAPAAVPEVTAVGGTEFSGDLVNPSLYWSATNNANMGSALQYIPEMGWNDTTAAIQNGGSLDGTGGGASKVFAKPVWQTGTGVPADGVRDVPDIAFSASNAQDPYLICSNSNCTNGFRAADNSLFAVGGTSVSTPIFAGAVAILNQAAVKNGKTAGQGNLNPALYALAASTPTAFHDVTTGNNIVPCLSGSTGCPVSGQFGFSAGVGYDQVTGLGSADLNLLVNTLASASVAPDFAATATTPPTIAPGATTDSTLTFNSLNDYANTLTVTCASPSIEVGCVVNPGTVQLTAGGSATAIVTITTTNQALRTSPLRAVAVPTSRPGQPWAPLSGGLLLLGATLVVLPMSRRGRRLGVWAGLALVMAGIAVLTACGGGSTPPAPYTVSISPSTLASGVVSGTTQQFTAVATNGSVSSQVTWSATGAGTISSTGLFTANTVTASTAASVTATATADTTAKATVNFNVVPPPARIYNLTITATDGTLTHNVTLPVTVQ